MAFICHCIRIVTIKLSSQSLNSTVLDPPPYKPLVWHYQQQHTDLIKQAIELFYCEQSLSHLDVNKQVSVFSETIMNIFENFIPQETITCNDNHCHDPHSINKQIKTFIAEKALSINVLSEEYQTLIYLINLMLFKLNYKARSIFVNLNTIRKPQKKLSDPSTNSKCYRSQLNPLLNSRKIPCVPPFFSR